MEKYTDILYNIIVVIWDYVFNVENIKWKKIP